MQPMLAPRSSDQSNTSFMQHHSEKQNQKGQRRLCCNQTSPNILNTNKYNNQIDPDQAPRMRETTESPLLTKGGQIARAAGTYAQFVGRDGGYAQIRLSSGELRMVRQECLATIGAVSNPDNSNQNFGKAGRMRHKGIRPSVRGVVMNPIDHPHGGGEGRTSGGRHPVTPWGKPTKGKKTRNKNKASQKLIIRSRHAKKKGR